MAVVTSCENRELLSSLSISNIWALSLGYVTPIARPDIKANYYTPSKGHKHHDIFFTGQMLILLSDPFFKSWNYLAN